MLHAATGLRSEISGHAPDKRIEHITIENLRYGGKPVTDAAGMGLRLNEHVADVRFAPVGDADSGCELWDQTTPALRCVGGGE